MRISLSMLFVFFLFVAFNLHGQSAIVKNIDSSALQELLKENNIQLIDVRTDREFTKGHIKGAQQINISSSDFINKIEKLDQSKPVVLYCAVGGRSTTAMRMIKHLNFPVIYNFVGGVREWKGKKLPLEKS